MALSGEGKIQLEIVTPRGRALSVSADEVTAPSVNGEFGVMPGHLPTIAAIRTGLVSYRQGAETTRCAVGVGFAEAGADKVLILTDQFVERPGIDPVLVRKELAEVQSKIGALESKSDVAAATTTGRAQVLHQTDNEIRISLSAETQADPELKLLIAKEGWLAAQLELYGDAPPATMRPFEEWSTATPTYDDETSTDDDDSGDKARGTKKASK